MAAQPSTQGWPKGLTLVVDYLTVDEETALVNSLDELPWLGEIQRRTQQYGYHYSYRKQRVDDTPVPPLPACVRFLLDRFQDDHVPLVAHQLIINEYQPGEQIKPHIDSTTDWGDCVVSLSLLDDWDMIFTHPGHVRFIVRVHSSSERNASPRSMAFARRWRAGHVASPSPFASTRKRPRCPPHQRHEHNQLARPMKATTLHVTPPLLNRFIYKGGAPWVDPS